MNFNEQFLLIKFYYLIGENDNIYVPQYNLERRLEC